MKYLVVEVLFVLLLIFVAVEFTVSSNKANNMKLKQFHKECLLKNGKIKSDFYFTYCSTSAGNIVFEDE